MVATITGVQKCRPEGVQDALEAALRGDRADRLALWQEGAADRDHARQLLLARGDREGLAWLAHLESLVAADLGFQDQALSAAHEAFRLAEGRINPPGVALILTQLAAAAWKRGERRMAVRAARRAEATLVASAGEDCAPVLAVRAQLAGFLELSERDATAVISRRDRTLRALSHAPGWFRDEVRLSALGRVFTAQGLTPHWARVHAIGWDHVLGLA